MIPALIKHGGSDRIRAALEKAGNKGLTMEEMALYYFMGPEQPRGSDSSIRAIIVRLSDKLKRDGLKIQCDHLLRSSDHVPSRFSIQPLVDVVKPAIEEPAPEPREFVTSSGVQAVRWIIGRDFDTCGQKVSLPYISALADRVSA